MTHLSPAEFVDLIDGTLPPARAAHADACRDCGAQAAALRAVLRQAQADGDVPEPPPFFWDRLSANVRGAVADSRPAGGLRALVPLASAAALVIALGCVWMMRTRVEPASTAQPASAPSAERAVAALAESAIDSANREVWDVLTAVASDMRIEDATAAGLSVRPSAIDGAVQEMSADERNELGRLLKSELKRSGN